jgi:hypothetical protein
MNKGTINKVDEYLRIINKVHSHKISIFGSFVLGNDTDDINIFRNTADFIEDAKIAFSMINILTPPPGSKLFQRLEKEGRILHREWVKYNTDSVCFQPSLMTPAQLKNGRNQTLQEIYSYSRLYKRLNTLWSKGVLTKIGISGNKNTLQLFTKGRILFTLVSLFNKDFRRIIFVLKSLWNHNIGSVSSVGLALAFHDYAYKKKSIRNIKFRFSDEFFFIDLIPHFQLSLVKKNDVICKIKELIKVSWGDPGGLIDDWISSADVLVLSYKDEDLRGFSIVNHVQDNIFYLRATVIHQEDINKGLGKFMNYLCVKFLINEKHGIWKFWKCLENIYFISCISNPLAYATIFKKRKVYPTLENAYKLSAQDKEVALKVTKRFCPNAVFDTETFVLKGDLKPYPDLIYKKEKIPWSNDKKIDEFFEDRLKLTQEEGNTLLVLWKESLVSFFVKGFIYKFNYLMR